MTTKSLSLACLLCLGVFGMAGMSRAYARAATGAGANNIAAADPVAVHPSSVDVVAGEHDRILKLAEVAMTADPITITKYRAKWSPGGPNDFYSNGDFWWPNKATSNSLPYIRHEGQTNPGNFNDHRRCLSQFRDNLSALAAAYKITGDSRYAVIAVEWLRVFFLDPATRMNPNLRYAQSIPGISSGRGIGIIDTLPLVEVPMAVEAVERSPRFPPDVSVGVKKWFADYLEWMTGSTNGQSVAESPDDHAVMYWLQIAVFAKFVGDEDELASCHNRFKFFFLANQMAPDGSFPHELARPKSYGYSICQLDNMTTLCQVLSTPDDDLWNFGFPEKGSIRRAVDYMYPYLEDKSKWPKRSAAEEAWPMRQSNLLFAALAYNDPKYLALWKKLNPDPVDEEVRRNTGVTQPVLWIK